MAHKCLKNTIENAKEAKFVLSEKEKKMLAEVEIVATCYEYIIACYMSKKYPNLDEIVEKFGGSDLIVNKESVEMKTEKHQSTGWLSGIFG
jgi:hypothetical protein